MYESPILTISKKLDIVKYDTNVTYWKTQMLGCKMLKSILRSPIVFFDMNPVGRIINRFSNDIS